MPNDDAEQVREGLKHKLYLDYLMDGKLFLAPIGDNPQKIVDLGTGVGMWAQDGWSFAFEQTSLELTLNPSQSQKTSPARVSLERTYRPSNRIGLLQMLSFG